MKIIGWIFLCIIGGILMIISSVVGSITFFETLFSAIEAEIDNEGVSKIVALVIQILAYIAMAGGISVIVGALIVAMNHYRLGKFIISLGAGMGLLSLIIFFISGIFGGTTVEDVKGIVLGIVNGSYGFLGILLTIIARLKMKKE